MSYGGGSKGLGVKKSVGFLIWWGDIEVLDSASEYLLSAPLFKVVPKLMIRASFLFPPFFRRNLY